MYKKDAQKEVDSLVKLLRYHCLTLKISWQNKYLTIKDTDKIEVIDEQDVTDLELNEIINTRCD